MDPQSLHINQKHMHLCILATSMIVIIIIVINNIVDHHGFSEPSYQSKTFATSLHQLDIASVLSVPLCNDTFLHADV